MGKGKEKTGLQVKYDLPEMLASWRRVLIHVATIVVSRHSPVSIAGCDRQR